MSGIGAVSAAGMSVATGATSRPAYRRLVAATMIGNLLEWYDFAVYAFVATILARHFFPNGSDTAAFPGPLHSMQGVEKSLPLQIS